MSEFRVAIAGAGLAGLTLARIMHRAGIDVSVFERDASIDSRYAGYRVHINSSGTTALHRALEPELWDVFVAASGMPDDSMRVFDDQFRPGPLRDNRDSAGIGRPTDDIPEHLAVCRATARLTLFHGFEEHVFFGHRITGYENVSDTGRVRLLTTEGSVGDFDLLIAADGINSAVRAQRLPEMRVIDLGSRHIAAKVPLTSETMAVLPEDLMCLFAIAKDDAGVGLTFGPLFRSDPGNPIMQRMPAALQEEVRSDYALSIFNITADRCVDDDELFAMTAEELRAYALDRMSGWAPELRTVVEQWDAATIQPLTLRSMVPVPAWDPTNVTMVGDSLHAMSSALGIGANTALRDASELGQRIIDARAAGTPIIDAVGGYEAAVRDYGFDAVRASARVGHWVIGHDDIATAGSESARGQ